MTLVQPSTTTEPLAFSAQKGSSPEREALQKQLKASGFSDQETQEVMNEVRDQDLAGLSAEDLAQLVEMLKSRGAGGKGGNAGGGGGAGAGGGSGGGGGGGRGLGGLGGAGKGSGARGMPVNDSLARPNAAPYGPNQNSRTTLGKKGAATVDAAYKSYREQLAAGKGQPNAANSAALDRQLAQTVTVDGRTMTRGQLVDEIAKKANMPPRLVAALWKREDDAMRTDRYFHNGEKLGRTTQNVPKGIYFGKDQFIEASVHALGQKRAIADKVGLSYGSTDRAAMAAFAEGYNGFGYRQRGVSNPYVGAGTDLYSGGKYVRDGVYDPNARDKQPGVLSML